MRFQQFLTVTLAIATFNSLVSLPSYASFSNIDTLDTSLSFSAQDKLKAQKNAPAKNLIKSSNPKAGVVSGPKFQKVEAKNLQAYKHKTGLFAIDIPKAWQLVDSSKPGETIILWFDPSKNALIAIDIFKAPTNLAASKTPELLQSYLRQTFGSRPNFAMEAPVKQADGSFQIVWGYTETIPVGKETASGWIQGNSFIEIKGDKLSLLTVGFLAPQFNELKDPLNKVVNSYKVTPTVQIP